LLAGKILPNDKPSSFSLLFVTVCLEMHYLSVSNKSSSSKNILKKFANKNRQARKSKKTIELKAKFALYYLIYLSIKRYSMNTVFNL